MTIAEQDWQRAVELLSGAQRVALACHVDPDGDALGSMLAMRHQLAQRGVEVTASYGAAVDRDTPFTIPPQYTFLPGLSELTRPKDFPEAPELLIAFDCASLARLGSLRPHAERAGTVLVLDHHASGAAFGDIRLVDAEAPATAVVVAGLLDRLGFELDRDTAICLYVGLVTDTGRFAYASTTAETMQLGARLLEFDIDHAAINRRVWETHSFGYLKVLARALERATIVPSAGLTWTVITQADLDDLGITLAETEGLIDVLRAVDVADCALVLKEQADGSWKATMRSKGRVNVGILAEHMGGGGHAFAAGFTAAEDLEVVVDAVVMLLEDDEVTGEIAVPDPAPMASGTAG
jgi:bifunctional oligoribonuclease and PAP phosphatase NrnA